MPRLGGTHLADNQLTSATDPRGEVELSVTYNAERVASITARGEKYRYRYDAQRTWVSNAFNQVALLTAHRTGLTQSSQGYSGSTTRIRFGADLTVESIALNGTSVVSWKNGKSGGRREAIVKTSKNGPINYDMKIEDGRLTEVSSSDGLAATYEYDSVGRVVSASDFDGDRRYAYDKAGSLIGFSSEGSNIRLQNNQYGVTTAITKNGKLLANVEFDETDRVSVLDIFVDGSRHRSTYVNRPDGLRDRAKYDASKSAIDFEYDAVGTLTELEFENSRGETRRETYITGIGNRVEQVQREPSADFSVEYNAIDLPVRLTQDDREARIIYDDVGRIVSAEVDGEETFSIDYAPLSQGAVAAADARTAHKRINQPIASFVFGSVNDIVFSRLTGSPYGPIGFDSASARFTMDYVPFVAPDAAQLSSLNRRSLLTNRSNLSVQPLGFDKPSNSFFIPPEFYTVNCGFCFGIISDVIIRVDGSTAPTTADVGEQLMFDIDASGPCFSTSIFGPPTTYDHTMTFGDLHVATKSVTGNPDTTFNHTYEDPDNYLVHSSVECSCKGFFGRDTDSHVVIVASPSPTPIEIVLTFDDGPTSAGADNTRTAINALNGFSPPAHSTFFVQTHVFNRLAAPNGAANVELAISTGHEIGIHTGWTADHVPHTTRVVESAYDVDNDGVADGLNALESDMIRAKAAIDALAGGTVPTLVHAPFLDLAHADIAPTYARQGLTHIGINIKGDDISSPSYGTITANLQSEVAAKIGAGLQSIIILFHDTRSATSTNLATADGNPGYIQTIKDAVENAGNYTAVFNTVQ